MKYTPLIVILVTTGLIVFAANQIAPSVEALFSGIVDRIDYAIGYPGGR